MALKSPLTPARPARNELAARRSRSERMTKGGKHVTAAGLKLQRMPARESGGESPGLHGALAQEDWGYRLTCEGAKP